MQFQGAGGPEYDNATIAECREIDHWDTLTKTTYSNPLPPQNALIGSVPIHTQYVD